MKNDKVKITNKKHPFYNTIGFILKENVLTFKGKRTKIEIAESGDMNGRTFFASIEDYQIIGGKNVVVC
jgi:hypothetical protein